MCKPLTCDLLPQLMNTQKTRLRCIALVLVLMMAGLQAARATCTYKVLGGDTLSEIAEFCGCSGATYEICNMNDIIEDCDHIHRGWVIDLPSSCSNCC
jgi:hypothetical protein